MKIYAILFVTLITIFVLIYLFKQRMDIHKYFESIEEFSINSNQEKQTHLDTKGSVEFDETTSKGKKAEFKKIENKPVLSISSYNSQNDLPLKELVVKSSANTGLTGNYMNLDMIKFVLMRGCRFLDFEVYSIDGTPHIGYSTSDNVATLDSKNEIPLDDAFNTINNMAFQSQVPNQNDPLFIHLRIKSNNGEIYKKIAGIIKSNLSNKLYNEDIDGSTKISQLMGKYVILVDKSLANDYDKYPICKSDSDENCMNLKKFVSLESATIQFKSNKSDYLLQQRLTPPFVIDDNKTDVFTYQMVLPDANTNFFNMNNNPKSDILIKDYGVQIVCFNFFNFDKNFEKYEDMFFHFNSAFVPLSKCITYIKGLGE